MARSTSNRLHTELSEAKDRQLTRSCKDASLLRGWLFEFVHVSILVGDGHIFTLLPRLVLNKPCKESLLHGIADHRVLNDLSHLRVAEAVVTKGK